LVATKFSEEEILHYVGQAASFIRSQRDSYYEAAQPLSAVRMDRFKPFFSESILKGTRFFVKADGPIQDPDFLRELNDRGIAYSLEKTQATTFIDTVVSYEPLDIQIQFHELVHAVQYQKLGLKQFANKYSRALLSTGDYWKIPLEINAYQLDKAYAQEPDQPFSVEQEVQRWINENRF
jgi:hypothetical protein